MDVFQGWFFALVFGDEKEGGAVGDEPVFVFEGVAVVASHELKIAGEGLACGENFSSEQFSLFDGVGRKAVVLPGKIQESLTLTSDHLKTGSQSSVGLFPLDDSHELVRAIGVFEDCGDTPGFRNFGSTSARGLSLRI